ncbi:MAG: hypothetical protein LBD75_03615 [Candidatus Peribacteria bacterium]|jgi:hypothetical protein|nr:hypothetical protein [Candidatus Peribacteria bacterium]
MDKKQEHDVYSYIIQKYGTPRIIVKKFKTDFPDFKDKDVKITDVSGNAYNDKISFKK